MIRRKQGNKSKGFSLQFLSSNDFPRIRIIPRDRISSFISFTYPRPRGRKEFSTGKIIDLKAATAVLLQKRHITLDQASKILNTTHFKQTDNNDFKISPKLIEYNLADVSATAELYHSLKNEYAKLGLGDLELGKIYSTATIVKYILRKMGLRSSWPIENNLLGPAGKVFSTYYGGLCQLFIRKQPIEISVLDFNGMYISLFFLLKLQSLLFAEKILVKDCTEEVQRLLDHVTIESLQDKSLWPRLAVTCEMPPGEYLLPVNALCGSGRLPKLSLSHVRMKSKANYSLPDLIASKLLTGRTPKITKAFRFEAVGQQDLKTVKVLGMELNPSKDDIALKLLNRRAELKKYPEESRERMYAKMLKTVASSLYGISIELNPQESLENVSVYSNEQFEAEMEYEEPGPYFAPWIGSSIAAGGRLLLCLGEAKLKQIGTRPIYNDTDSIFCPVGYEDELVKFFQPLSPLGKNAPFLEVEIRKKWFFGISAKRYCLFEQTKKGIEIVDGWWKAHGLGYLMNPFGGKGDAWMKKFWHDIVSVSLGLADPPSVLERYRGLPALSKLSITSMNVLDRFSKMNEGRPFCKQVKPFNFFIVGQPSSLKDGRMVKPIAPFCKDPRSVVHKPFINYETGEVLQGSQYWATLEDTFIRFLNHPEDKYENGSEEGWMKRRHLTVDGFRYIGKQVKNVDLQILEGEAPQEVVNISKLVSKFRKASSPELRAAGISRQTEFEIRKRLGEDAVPKLSEKIIERLKKLEGK
ncbi:MAG: hypothetical protein ABIC95_06005 [archaeon]